MTFPIKDCKINNYFRKKKKNKKQEGVKDGYVKRGRKGFQMNYFSTKYFM